VSSSAIFKVKEILSVSRFESYCAIGSGAAHAEGALHVAYDVLQSARDVAMAAMSAALAFDGASGGEIRVHEALARIKGARRRG
jgi:ATP-dependent protease HslVU (ClpYQ) peptidase subunit